jgi:hypothetical protein
MQLIHAVSRRAGQMSTQAAHGGKMTIQPGENGFLHNLEAEVEVEVTIAEASRPDESVGGPADWLLDPTEAERDEVGLRSLLGAVEALEGDDPTDRTVDERPEAP